MFDEPQAPQSVPELSKENLDICKRFLCILGIEADKYDQQIANLLTQIDQFWKASGRYDFRGAPKSESYVLH